jgi:hypothetical protein
MLPQHFSTFEFSFDATLIAAWMWGVHNRTVKIPYRFGGAKIEI